MKSYSVEMLLCMPLLSLLIIIIIIIICATRKLPATEPYLPLQLVLIFNCSFYCYQITFQSLIGTNFTFDMSTKSRVVDSIDIVNIQETETTEGQTQNKMVKVRASCLARWFNFLRVRFDRSSFAAELSC